MTDHPVALMALDDRVMHLPSDVHGQALCGEDMRDPWMAGPFYTVAEIAIIVCDSGCFD